MGEKKANRKERTQAGKGACGRVSGVSARVSELDMLFVVCVRTCR